MTPLQILDRIAFCIGYLIIGGVAFVLIVFAIAWIGVVLKIGLKRDDEKRQDD